MSAYRNAPWQQVIHEHELHLLRWVGKHHREPLIYDVGANEGQYVRAARSVLGDRAIVVCVEPNPTCLPELRQAGADAIEAVALSSQPGNRAMYMKIPEGPDIEASFHLRRDLHLLARYGYKRLYRLPAVETRTLDELARDEQIHLLKVDVEGHELEVLSGGLGTLERVESIQLEYSFTNSFNPSLRLSDFRDLLEPRGFRLLVPQAGNWRPLPKQGISATGQTDVLATRRRDAP